MDPTRCSPFFDRDEAKLSSFCSTLVRPDNHQPRVNFPLAIQLPMEGAAKRKKMETPIKRAKSTMFAAWPFTFMSIVKLIANESETNKS